VAIRDAPRERAEARLELILPPVMVEREPELAGLVPGPLAAAEMAATLERALAERDEAKRRLAMADEAVRRAEAHLAELLEAGEGVQVPGALYFAAYGPDGAAEPSLTALRAHADVLGPMGLAPREVTTVKLPTVAAIRQAHRRLQELGIRRGAAALLVEPPMRVKLRRRRVGTGEA
jgi:hypothetical protein